MRLRYFAVEFALVSGQWMRIPAGLFRKRALALEAQQRMEYVHGVPARIKIVL